MIHPVAAAGWLDRSAAGGGAVPHRPAQRADTAAALQPPAAAWTSSPVRSAGYTGLGSLLSKEMVQIYSDKSSSSVSRNSLIEATQLYYSAK